MHYQIARTTASHFSGLYQAIDNVAKERRYLAFLQAPPLPAATAFFQNIVNNDLCQLLALDGDRVVGWCDVLPAFGDARTHVGGLGMGLLPEARHQGLGRKLIDAALHLAWGQGFTRIQLSVRTDNRNAKALYERVGFVVEGVHQRDLCVDGRYVDSYAMALLR